jgi:hypothetical protein
MFFSQVFAGDGGGVTDDLSCACVFWKHCMGRMIWLFCWMTWACGTEFWVMKVLSLVETFVSIGCQWITEVVVSRLRTLYRQSCDESVRERRVEDSAVLAWASVNDWVIRKPVVLCFHNVSVRFLIVCVSFSKCFKVLQLWEKVCGWILFGFYNCNFSVHNFEIIEVHFCILDPHAVFHRSNTTL